MGNTDPNNASGDGAGKKHRLDEENKMDMEAKAKKSKVDKENEAEDSEDEVESDSDSDDVDIGEDEDDEEDMEEGDLPDNLIVDFEGVPPNPNDIGAVDALVGQVYRGLPINSLDISRLIVESEFLSTLLKDQDLDNPSTYGVCSVLNLSHPTQGLNLEIAQKIREMVVHGIEEQYKREKINKDVPDVLKNFDISTERAPATMIGLVVAEKLVNIPSQAVWQLFTTLKEDMDYENQTFTHFFLMTKHYRVGEEIFPVEDYYEPFENMSSTKIDFPLPKDADTIPHNGNAGIPFRRLLIIPSAGFLQVINTGAASLLTSA